MKRILILLLAAAGVAGSVRAQSYSQLWQQADEAVRQDLPQTALAAVRRVGDKALAENDDAQLLRAALAAQQLQAAVSPDSGRVVLARMEAALAREERPVVRALWHGALGCLLQSVSTARDTADLRRARTHLLASLADLPALSAARAADFVPLFREGGDSRYFGNDVLHVLWRSAADSRCLPDSTRAALSGAVARHYAAAGRREAALLVRLDSVADLSPVPGRLDEQPAWRALSRLAGEYRDLPLNVETYVALTELGGYGQAEEQADSLRLAAARTGLELYGREPRAAVLHNFVTRIGLPSLQVSGAVPLCYPGRPVRLAFEGRNVRRAEVRFTRLDLSARTLDHASTSWTLKALRRHRTGRVQTLGRDLAPLPAYRRQRDSIDWTPSAPGVYLCELLADGTALDHCVVHVTRLQPLQLAQPDGKLRLVVVDARSGHPVPGARVVAVDGNGRQQAAYTLDATGTLSLTPPSGRSAGSCYVSVSGDEAAPAFTLSAAGGTSLRSCTAREEKPVQRLELFTDRAIYRPGQTVCLGAVAYERQGDDFRVVPDFSGWVRLLDVNSRIVDSVRLTADAFGAAGARLTLPEACLPGRFLLRCEWNGSSYQTSVQVEEYKRPTFTAEVEPVRTTYALGDTVPVWGRVRTYTDLPVADATVRWEVTRRAWLWSAEALPAASGTVRTDADGRFCVPVVLACRPGEQSSWRLARFSYVLTFDATAGNGETASGSYTLSAATRAAWFETSWPQTVCREQLPAVQVWQRNAQGQNVEAEGRYELRRDGRLLAEGAFRTGQAFVPEALRALPSGEYQLIHRLLPGPDAVAAPDTARLLLFSEYDTRPASPAVCWTDVRPSAGRDSARVLLGSSADSVLLFYDLFMADRLLESRRIAFSDSLLRFDLAWQPAYGDCARAVFAFVKDGQVYRAEATVERPVPEKRLVLSWSTFRSRLVPGQQEEWRLRVTYPDGRPARASVMARLYDASLDALTARPWAFSGLGIYRRQPVVYWQGDRYTYFSLSGTGTVRMRRVPSLVFTDWADGLFSYGPRTYGVVSIAERAMSASLDEAAVTDGLMQRSLRPQLLAKSAAPVDAAAGNGGAVSAPTPRTNFAETAYFHPSLHTDSTGTVGIAFTLPESLTSWNFSALAHSVAMDYGGLDTTVVARKDFMVQAALPRFVREGDRTDLAATLRNLLPRAVDVTVRLEVVDAETGRTVADAREQVRLSADSSCLVRFPFQATVGDAVLVCRLTAGGDGFSDGEEHYLPVLSNRVNVTRTLPFSLTEVGTVTLRLDTLWTSEEATRRRLTVELSSRPAWYAVAALPVLADAQCRNAEEWATRYYALKLGGYVAQLNPAVKAALDSVAGGEAPVDALARLVAEQAGWAEETPWLAEAAAEVCRAAALRSLFDPAVSAAKEYTALDKLRDLQRADGSWSWYEGMAGNAAVTTQVAVLLARVQAFTGDGTAADVLKRALGFLQARAAAEAERLHEAEQRTGTAPQLPREQLRYLYVRALLGLEPDDDARYLLGLTEVQAAGMNLQDKAMAVLVLAQSGREETARRQLQSLLEYTVAAPGRGRYFDTARAPLSRESYRIPTQTAVIEALQRLCAPGDERVEELRLWLMQAKRTQAWETGRATADAVYALLVPSPLSSSRARLDGGAPLYYTLSKGRRIVGVNAASTTQALATAGYTRDSYAAAPAVDATRLTVRKADDGLSWGAVYANFNVPAEAIRTEGRGLTLTRRCEVKRGGTWQPLAEGNAVESGERVRQVFTVRADADYDFVVLRSARPAGLEPVRALSGYSWQDGVGCYRAVRDASTEYFFEHVAKGEHVFTEEAVAARTGDYRSGLAEVRCVYAPEFGGQAGPFRLTVR